jgi:hypothetical protein
MARICTASLIVLVAEGDMCRCAHSTAQCCKISMCCSTVQCRTIQCRYSPVWCSVAGCTASSDCTEYGTICAVTIRMRVPALSDGYCLRLLSEPRVQTHTELMLMFLCGFVCRQPEHTTSLQAVLHHHIIRCAVLRVHAINMCTEPVAVPVHAG